MRASSSSSERTAIGIESEVDEDEEEVEEAEVDEVSEVVVDDDEVSVD